MCLRPMYFGEVQRWKLRGARAALWWESKGEGLRGRECEDGEAGMR